MKNLFFFLVLLLTITSCKKDPVIPVKTTQEKIMGTWVQESAEVWYNGTFQYTSGNSAAIVFNQYDYVNQTDNLSGVWHVVNDSQVEIDGNVWDITVLSETQFYIQRLHPYAGQVLPSDALLKIKFHK